MLTTMLKLSGPSTVGSARIISRMNRVTPLRISISANTRPAPAAS